MNLAEYKHALEGVAFAGEYSAGRIFMRGKDRAALLHRLSTNDIERLKPGEGTLTVLTTPIGRIIDLLTVHALPDALLLVTSPDQGPAVYGHLKRNIFFNDQVTLEPAGRSYNQIALYGPRAPELLATLAGIEVEPPLYGTISITIGGIDVLAAGRKPIGGHGFTLFPPADAHETVRAALLNAGATSLSDATFDVLRIEQGYGAFGRELSQDYIPLETGLLDAVSFHKGCYVGQEIIARMESRGRMAKRLCGLKLTETVTAPANLFVDGKDAGHLTSATISPRYGAIALAYVRTAHAEAGEIVSIGDNGVSGTVVELPFA